MILIHGHVPCLSVRFLKNIMGDLMTSLLASPPLPYFQNPKRTRKCPPLDVSKNQKPTKTWPLSLLLPFKKTLRYKIMFLSLDFQKSPSCHMSCLPYFLPQKESEVHGHESPKRRNKADHVSACSAASSKKLHRPKAMSPTTLPSPSKTRYQHVPCPALSAGALKNIKT
jgi:hypothetical protein